MSSEPETWHYGLVASWWANFNDSFRSHEIDYFREWVEEGSLRSTPVVTCPPT